MREMVKKAVVQQDREFEEAERKRTGIAELEAAEAEAEARKKARIEREDSRRSPVSVASPVMDATMIAQIAEQARANLSIADLERMLNERKASEQSRSSQDVVMKERTAELEEMKDAAKERRSKAVEAAAEKKDEVEGEDLD